MPLSRSALLGFLGTLRVIPALARGEFNRPAVMAQLAMMVLMGIYVALGVKSFKAARRARLRGRSADVGFRRAPEIEVNGGA